MLEVMLQISSPRWSTRQALQLKAMLVRIFSRSSPKRARLHSLDSSLVQLSYEPLTLDF